MNVIKNFVCRPEISPKSFDKLNAENARTLPNSAQNAAQAGKPGPTYNTWLSTWTISSWRISKSVT